MTAPPFIFNHKTGELSRNGIVTTLPRLHADMFACFAQAQAPIGTGAIARATNQPEHSIKDEMRHLIKRLKPLGILIARENGRGSWLVFEDVRKWKPTISDPVRLPGECP
jgi:hypothetical protein